MATPLATATVAVGVLSGAGALGAAWRLAGALVPATIGKTAASAVSSATGDDVTVATDGNYSSYRLAAAVKAPKTVYFVRHAQGEHNKIEQDEGNNLMLLAANDTEKLYKDAYLSELGEQQCAKLQRSLRAMTGRGEAFTCPLQLDLVVTSAMTRTIQTATLGLGDPATKRGEADDVPPFLATDLCRERVGIYSCDERRSVTQLRAEFKGIAFDSATTENEDLMFRERKEDDEVCKARGVEFLKWLCARDEARIAVVTHSHFLHNLFHHLRAAAGDDAPALPDRVGNAELVQLDLYPAPGA